MPTAAPAAPRPHAAATASSMPAIVRLAAALLAAAAFGAHAAAVAVEAGATDDIVVNVRKDGPAVAVEVDCPVQAPRAVAWDVLTDYDGMARFVSSLEQSVVRVRFGNRVQVFQKGKAALGPFTLAFANLREVELVPQDEIRSRIVSGDMRPAAFTTRLEQRGPVLHVVHAGTYTPAQWVPPVIGPALIAAQTRKQYGEIRDEILRRAAAR